MASLAEVLRSEGHWGRVAALQDCARACTDAERAVLASWARTGPGSGPPFEQQRERILAIEALAAQPERPEVRPALLACLERPDPVAVAALGVLCRSGAPDPAAAAACRRLLALPDRVRGEDEAPLSELWAAAVEGLWRCGPRDRADAERLHALLDRAEVAFERDPMRRSLQQAHRAVLVAFTEWDDLPDDIVDTLARVVDGRRRGHFELLSGRAVAPLARAGGDRGAIRARIAFLVEHGWAAVEDLPAALPWLDEALQFELIARVAGIDRHLPALVEGLAALEPQVSRGPLLAMARSRRAPQRRAFLDAAAPGIGAGDLAVLDAALALAADRSQGVRLALARLLGALPPGILAHRWEAVLAALEALAADGDRAVSRAGRAARRAVPEQPPARCALPPWASAVPAAPELPPAPPLRGEEVLAAPPLASPVGVALDESVDPARRAAACRQLAAPEHAGDAAFDALGELLLGRGTPERERLASEVVRALAAHAERWPRAAALLLERAARLDYGGIEALGAVAALSARGIGREGALALARRILDRDAPAQASRGRWDLLQAGAANVLRTAGAPQDQGRLARWLRFDATPTLGLDTVSFPVLAALEALGPLEGVALEVVRDLARGASVTGPPAPLAPRAIDPRLRARAMRTLLSAAAPETWPEVELAEQVERLAARGDAVAIDSVADLLPTLRDPICRGAALEAAARAGLPAD